MELIKSLDETLLFDNKTIRIIGSYDEPFFVVNDICKILDIKNVTQAVQIIPEKSKKSGIIKTTSGDQLMLVINEAGLYKLIMRSNKPIAQKFQEVVCEEILPSIRKTGEFKLKKMLEEKEKVIELKDKKTKSKIIQKELNENKANLVETTIKFETLNKNHNKMLRLRKRDLFEKGNVCYIISHKNFDVNGKIYRKIGKATQSKSEGTPAFTNRLTGYNTGAPVNYTVHYLIYVDDNDLLERTIKYRFKDQTVESNKEEWIEDCPMEKIVFFCRKICDDMKMPYKERIIDESLTSLLEKSVEETEEETEEDTEEDTDSVEKADNKDVEYDSEIEIVEESDEEDDNCEIETEKEITKHSPLQELQGECRKHKLSEQGTQAELFNRIKYFIETGERMEYKTLEELREICKGHGLVHTGNKDIMEERIRHFLKTGEKVRIVNDEKCEESRISEPTDSREEKEKILKSLPTLKYTEMVSVCSIYKLLTTGTIDVLRERITKSFEKGEKDGDRRIDVYQYDNKGVLIKHFKSVMEAKEKLDLSEVLKNSLDKNYTLNGFIFRSKHVLFTEKDLEEINKIKKVTKRRLSKEDHTEINKRFYKGGETQPKLMKEYSISRTQIRRILGKSKS